MKFSVAFTLVILMTPCISLYGMTGSGTPQNPYIISSLADFDEFAADSNYWDDYIRLDCDIDLSGRTYTNAVIAPDISLEIDFQGTKFTGVFDGNNHSISNLVISSTGNTHLGLFGYTEEEALGRPERENAICRHTQPKNFKSEKPLDLELSVETKIRSARLYYRHVNHAERFNIIEMQGKGKIYRAKIPTDYTNSKYPLQYYFELTHGTDKVQLYPGFTEDLMNQPYFVVRTA